MQIPVFEIKDSYIVKHKLEYNTSYDFGVYNNGLFKSHKQKMLFVDYDIARKTQTLNAETFSYIKINDNLNNIEKIEIKYLDEIHTIYLNGNIEYENEFIKNVNNFNNIRPYNQIFKIESGNTINIDDIVNIEIYEKNTETGITSWEYNSSVINEPWSISGFTSSNDQWIVNSGNTSIGHDSGVTTWSVDTIIPLLRYQSKVIGKTLDGDIILEKKIDDYLFNNFSNYDDIYFKIITNNNCEPNYNDLYDKLKYYKYFDNFDYNINQNSITITPIKNSKNIYFYYDKISYNLYYKGYGYVREYPTTIEAMSNQLIYKDDAIIPTNINDIIYDDITPGYIEDVYFQKPYVMSYNISKYIFNTNNIYNKYNLELILNQFTLTNDIIYKGKTTNVNGTLTGSTELLLIINDLSYLNINDTVIIESISGNTYNIYYDININNISGNTVSIERPINFNNEERVLFISSNDKNILVNNWNYKEEEEYLSFEINNIFNYKEYTYIKIETINTEYNAIIKNISGDTISIIVPFNYVSGDTILNISNIKTISEISNLLDITFENYDHDEYNKLTIQQQRKIYNSYAEIINKEEYNQSIRVNTTGLIFENNKNIMTLKIFDPADFKDARLLYEPTEVVRIGKDRKTSIPFIIEKFKIGLTSDVINSNYYSIYLFNPNLEDILLVINSNLT